MKSIEFPASMLRAATCCVPKKDVRYYLLGVYLDGSRLVSTSGHVLFVGNLEVKSDFQCIIPIETVDLAMKALGKKGIQRTKVTVTQDGDKFSLHTVGAEFPFVPVDGTFPDYERIVPELPVISREIAEKGWIPTPQAEVAQFDPRLLMQCMEALTWAGDRPALGTIQHNGNGPALYTMEGCPAFCVVMPFRAGNPDRLSWFFGNRKKAA